MSFVIEHSVRILVFAGVYLFKHVECHVVFQ